MTYRFSDRRSSTEILQREREKVRVARNWRIWFCPRFGEERGEELRNLPPNEKNSAIYGHLIVSDYVCGRMQTDCDDALDYLSFAKLLYMSRFVIFLRLLTGPLLPGQNSKVLSSLSTAFSYFLFSISLLLLKFHFVVPNNKFHQFLNF